MKLGIAFLCFIIAGTNSLRIAPKPARADCAISVNNDITDPQPLILRPDAPVGQEWAYPSSGDIISVTEGSTLLLACPGGSVKVGATSLGVNSATATCVGGNTFSVGSSGQASFPTITCTVNPTHIARYTGASCEDNNREVEIGFDVSPNFLRLITICFDQVAQTTISTSFVSPTGIGGYQVGYPRPGSFAAGSFYNVGGPIDDRYKLENQRVVINNLLGLPADSLKYVGTGDYFLSRGHLAAKTDFVFGSQHRATFWFVNVAPQWQTFNGRNWGSLEDNVRDFEAGRANDIIVYTGTYGVATLPHETTGEEIPLYLYVNGEERGIPVPEVFWKVAYDPVLKAAIAFVGANNPYVETITPMCTNICNQISWLSWKPTDVVAGLAYCCDVRELRQTISFIPQMDVTSILQ